MLYTNLSTTDIRVSKACLGTMSFGAHVNEEEAFKIMDKALELGINFFDTAEMYAVPVCKETYGLTEEIIGRWMKSRGSRDKIVLATKVAGPGRKNHSDHIRDGKTKLDKKNIQAAVEESLKRLKTDYIDLYQLHWPDRGMNVFGQRAFIPRDNSDIGTEIEETLAALQDLQKQGLVREFGLSNESPWGIMKFLEAAKYKNLPRVVSVQNNYSLLTRTFDNALAEVSWREDIGLLAYSPLGYGVLGGRYLDGAEPEGGRFTTFPASTHPFFVPRYRTEKIEGIIKKYKALAEANGMTVAEMAHAFVYSRKFLTSCIIGPSNIAQLEESANAVNIQLSKEVFDAIDAINEECPSPCA